MGLFRKKTSHPPVSARPALPKTLSLPDLHDTPSGDLSLPSRWLDPTYKDSQLQPSLSSSTSNPQIWSSGSHQRMPSTSKTSFSTVRGMGFHRPFRGASGSNTPAEGGGGGSSPSASSFQTVGAKSAMGRVRSTRRKQQATPFNLGVVGGIGVGKSSLLRLILQSLELPPTASPLVHSKISSFGTSTDPNSRQDWTLSVEVESPATRGEKILLTVVDTPGLPFTAGKELELDRGVSVLMKELEGRLGVTLREESKVVRTTKNDDHIHLLLYLIDPISILQTAGSPIPPPLFTSNSFSPPPLPFLPLPLHPSSGNGHSDSTTPRPSATHLSMHLPQSQIRAITRLATRSNILPVLTKTDLLTIKQLTQVRAVIKRDLAAAAIDLGESVLLLGDEDEGEEASSEEEKEEALRANDGRLIHTTPIAKDKPKVIRLRSTRSSPKLNANGGSGSSPLAKRRPGGGRGRIPPPPMPPSPSTSSMSGQEDEQHPRKLLLPLALVAPEEDDEHGGDGRKFVREYPWGTLHVLNPDHSDFVPFQAALFSSVEHLKRITREIVFERFRMEKLLIRRATQALPEADRHNLVNGGK